MAKKGIKKYLKDIGNKRFVFDYQALKRSGFPIIVLIAERGYMGKTFGFKEFALDEYKKHGYYSSFVKTTEALIEKEKPNILLNHKLHYPEKWEEVIQKGNALLYQKKKFMDLVALSTSESQKGSRKPMKYLYYDEFNVGNVRNKSSLFDNLLMTYTSSYGEGVKNPLQVFIAGNNKTLADSILYDMGIYLIEDEITLFHANGEPLVMVLCPTKTQEQVEKIHAKNWVYQKAKISGTAEHMFSNSSAFDNVNGVISNLKNELVPVRSRHIATYTIEGEKFESFWIENHPKNGIWFTREFKPSDFKATRNSCSGVEVAATKKDGENGRAIFQSSGKLYLANMLKKNKVFYDSMYTKKGVIKLL